MTCVKRKYIHTYIYKWLDTVILEMPNLDISVLIKIMYTNTYKIFTHTRNDTNKDTQPICFVFYMYLTTKRTHTHTQIDAQCRVLFCKNVYATYLCIKRFKRFHFKWKKKHILNMNTLLLHFLFNYNALYLFIYIYCSLNLNHSLHCKNNIQSQRYLPQKWWLLLFFMHTYTH